MSDATQLQHIYGKITHLEIILCQRQNFKNWSSQIETTAYTYVLLVYHFVSGEKNFYQRQRQNVVGARDKKQRQRLYRGTPYFHL